MKPQLSDPTVYGSRAKLGVIVPPTNTANEAEWNRMVPEGVTVHTARMPLHTDTTSAHGKKSLYDDVGKFSRDLAQAGVSVVAYGCTAGSMVTPMEQLPDFMRKEIGLPAVTTAQSLVAALRALGVKKVAAATPYHDALNDHEIHFLADQGIETVAMRGLGIGANGPAEYRLIARVPLDQVYAHARGAFHADADALLISCTDFATLPLIERLEREIGKPVVTSNQATFWAALRAAGVDDRIDGCGALLRRH